MSNVEMIEFNTVAEGTSFAPPASVQPMSTAVAMANESSAMLKMIERVARDKTIDISRLERLIEMKREIEREAAKRAFIYSKAAAKSEIPVIKKNRHVGFKAKNGGSPTDYWHEDFAEIARTIDPILHKHGLDYGFKTAQANGFVTVTCILSHSDGHEQETVLTAPEDNSGNKNPLQKVASAVQYLMRYTLRAALGLAIAKDDDGRGGPDQNDPAGEPKSQGEPLISVDQVKVLRDAIAFRGRNEQRLLAYLNVSALEEVYAESFQWVLDLINQGVR